MKKQIIFITGMFLLSTIGYTQEVISSQGETYSNGSNMLDFTIGEPVIETASGGTNNLTQGFHQTRLTITSVEDLEVDFLVKIFPNPTSEYVILSMDKYKGLSFALFNLTGKLLKRETITKTTTKVHVSNYPKGTYLLSLLDQENKKIKTHKIIKK